MGLKFKGRHRAPRPLWMRLASVGVIGVTAVAAAIGYRRIKRQLTDDWHTLELPASTNGSLARPIEELLRESRFVEAITKAGWPLDPVSVSGMDGNNPYTLVKLPSNEYAKLCATPEGFALEVLVDTAGLFHTGPLLAAELRKPNLSYSEFKRYQENTKETASKPPKLNSQAGLQTT